MHRLRSLLAVPTLTILLVLPVSPVAAAQPVSSGWCFAPGNVVRYTIGWPPDWSPVSLTVFGYAVGVGDITHEPTGGNPVVVKEKSYTFEWVTAYPTAEHFVSAELFGRFDKNGGPHEWFLTTIQGVVSPACPV